MSRISSSEISRLSCFHSALASFCSRTRFHSCENGTSKRRRRILMMYAPTASSAAPTANHVHSAERDGPEEAHRRKPPERKILSTSSSNGIDVCVRKNGIAYFVQYASSSSQYFSCSLLVRLEQRLGDRDLARVAGLAVDEREVAVQLRRGLAQVVDLEHERLELVVAERVDALLEALRIVEVADHDREAAPLVLRDERPSCTRRARSGRRCRTSAGSRTRGRCGSCRATAAADR